MDLRHLPALGAAIEEGSFHRAARKLSYSQPAIGQQVAALMKNQSTYVAKPTQNGLTVIVVHDWCGRLPHILAFGDRLAESGFTAVAPDLYDGRATTDPAAAEEYMTSLVEKETTSRLLDAIQSLRSSNRAGSRRVGAIGFSMGGYFVTAAARAQALDCAVLYYASLDGAAPTSRVQCSATLPRSTSGIRLTHRSRASSSCGHAGYRASSTSVSAPSTRSQTETSPSGTKTPPRRPGSEALRF